MATKVISALTAVLAGNLTGAAVLPVDDANTNTRKATLAQLRTNLLAGGSGFTASDPLVVGGVTAATVATSTAFNAYQIALASTGTVVTGGLYVGSNGFAGIHLIASSNHGIGFSVNNGAPSLSIANTGTVTIASGLTVTAGGLTVSAGVTSLQSVTTVGGIKRGDASGAVSCVNATFTNAFTVNATGLWKVFVALPGAGAPYLLSAEVLADGPSGVFTIVNKSAGVGVDVQMSGSSLQIKQTSGVTQTMTFFVLEIA